MFYVRVDVSNIDVFLSIKCNSVSIQELVNKIELDERNAFKISAAISTKQ